MTQLSDEIDRIATTTQFNGINVLDGGFSDKQFQIGANAGQTMDITIGVYALPQCSASPVPLALRPPAQAPRRHRLRRTYWRQHEEHRRLPHRLDCHSLMPLEPRIPLTSQMLGQTYRRAVSTTLDSGDSFSKQDFVDHVNQVLAQSALSTPLPRVVFRGSLALSLLMSAIAMIMTASNLRSKSAIAHWKTSTSVRR